jgi:hypothetical protein
LPTLVYAQNEEPKNHTNLQTEFFYGNILRHNKNVGHLLTGHPTGFIINYNYRTTGDKEWQQEYNYPDFGYSFIYQDYKNSVLGESFGLNAFYNFYLLPREKRNNINFKIGFGLSYITNPYDKVTNPKNVAFGSHINANLTLGLNYKLKLNKNLQLNSGFVLLHTSNGSAKSPNTGVNVFAATIGVNYNLYTNLDFEYQSSSEKETFKEKIKYNFLFQFGLSESNFIGSGTKPFYDITFYADKRLNRKSAIQLGSELMLNYSLKDFIEITDITNESFEKGDFKRVGVFVGHELFISKSSIFTQFGYYVYYPFKFEGRIYERIGLKRYFNDKWFAVINLKAHFAKAETFSLGVGIRI